MGHILELKVQAQMRMRNLKDKLLKMLWCRKLLVEELQHKLTRAVDQCLLTGMIGMIQNISKNKDKHLSISKRNKKNLKLRLVLRKRRRSLKRRKRVESQVVMFLMLTLMTTTQLTITLASTLLKNLTWIKKKIVIDMRKKKFRKIWAIQELNKTEASLMLQAWIRMINLTTWMIRVEISITKEDQHQEDWTNMTVPKDQNW